MSDATRPYDTSGRGAGRAGTETMDTEPARIIARVRVIWNALVAILTATGFAVITPQLDGAVQDLINAAITLGIILYGIWTARHQGEVTRDAVYAPDTVKQERDAAYQKGLERGKSRAA